MDTVVLKNSLIASLFFVCVFLVFQNIDHRVSERIQLESTSAAFESLDKDFSAIKRNVDTEFNKLPKYVKPSKEQSINDALEFIKFSKQTFTDTMAQNEELLAEVKGFEKKANDVLEK
ncbi:hypothetical protein WCE01_16485 [Acinetobacter indicus]|uniref:hypothetical protein n=1 Tax=Acinetobacter indicus TaxID=756892 RepID=UPI0034D61B19